MADYIEIELTIADPVYLELDIEEQYYIGASKSGPQGESGEAAQIGTGAKYSSTDSGTLKQLSIDDDYLYICTTAGGAGSATWKKIPLFVSS